MDTQQYALFSSETDSARAQERSEYDYEADGGRCGNSNLCSIELQAQEGAQQAHGRAPAGSNDADGEYEYASGDAQYRAAQRAISDALSLRINAEFGAVIAEMGEVSTAAEGSEQADDFARNEDGAGGVGGVAVNAATNTGAASDNNNNNNNAAGGGGVQVSAQSLEAQALAREQAAQYQRGLRLLVHILQSVKHCKRWIVWYLLYSIYRIFAAVLVSTAVCTDCGHLHVLMTLIIAREMVHIAHCNRVIRELDTLREQLEAPHGAHANTIAILRALTTIVRAGRKQALQDAIIEAVFEVHRDLERCQQALEFCLRSLFYYSIWLYATALGRLDAQPFLPNTYLVLYFSLFAYWWLAGIAACLLFVVIVLVLVGAVGYKLSRKVQRAYKRARDQRKIEALRPKPFSSLPQETAARECAICLDEYSPETLVVTLPCSAMHQFHETCIKVWLNQNSICPICRKSLL